MEAGGGPLRFRVRGEGIAWVEVQLDGLPVAARGLGGRSVTLTVAPPDGMAPAVATFRGFAAEPRPGGGDVFRLVATLRRELSRSATGELR